MFKKASRFTVGSGVGVSLLLLVVWPALVTPARVFTKSFFTFWIIVVALWALIAGVFMIVFPLWEIREDIWLVLDNLVECNVQPKQQYWNPGDRSPQCTQQFPSSSSTV